MAAQSDSRLHHTIALAHHTCKGGSGVLSCPPVFPPCCLLARVQHVHAKKSINTGEQVFQRPFYGMNRHFIRNDSSPETQSPHNVIGDTAPFAKLYSYILSVCFRHVDVSGEFEPLSPVDGRHGKSSDNLYIYS